MDETLTVTCSACGASHEIAAPSDDDRDAPEPIVWECHAVTGTRDLPSTVNIDDGVEVEIPGGTVDVRCGTRNLLDDSGRGEHVIAPTEGATTVIDSEAGTTTDGGERA